MKYVSASESCEDQEEFFEVSRCSQEFHASFNSSYDEKRVCFKHPLYPDYILYPNITMEMKYVTGFAGSNQLAVNTRRNVHIVGKGIQANDVVKFVPAGFACNYVAREFVVMGVNTVTLEGFDTIGNYSMCYKFTNSVDAFMAYPNIILEVVNPYVSAVVPSYAIVNVPTVLQFYGTGITESDHVKFISSERDCNADSTGVTVFSVSATGTVSATFEDPLPSGKVCYRFGLNDTFVDVGLLFEVYSIRAIHPTEFVTEIPEQVSFYGIGITVRDEVAFVDARDSCEDSLLRFSLSDATVDVVANEIVLTTTITLRALRETEMAVCYKLYGVDEYIRLSQTVTVFENVISMENLDSPNYLYYVSNRQMTYRIEGRGVGRSENEKIRFLGQDSNSCDTDVIKELDVTREMDGVTRVTLQEEVRATVFMKVCYLFVGQTEFTMTDVRVPVLIINTVYLGNQELVSVYKDTDNVFSVSGYNIQTGDMMKFVDRMGQSEYSCLSSGSALHGQEPVTMTLMSTGRTEGVFRFTEPGLNLAMCYYFSAHNEMVLFSNIQVDVLDVEYESESVAIMGEPYEMTFSGVGQVMGDQMMWISSSATSCNPTSPMVVSSIETLDEHLKVTFLFSNVYRNLQLCVKSEDHPWTLLTEYTLDVVGVTSFNIPTYASWMDELDFTIMAHSSVNAEFNSGDEGDRAKFSPADSECEANLGVCGLMDVMNRTTVSLECVPSERVVLCYYFSRVHQWRKYSQFGLTVNGPTSLTSNVNVEGNNMVASIVLDGVNVADQCNEV